MVTRNMDIFFKKMIKIAGFVWTFYRTYKNDADEHSQSPGPSSHHEKEKVSEKNPTFINSNNKFICYIPPDLLYIYLWNTMTDSFYPKPGSTCNSN